MAVTDREVEAARLHMVAWLKWHMESTGIQSQAELGRRLGVSGATITFWLTGTGSLPAFRALLSIVKELKVPLDVLLTRGPPSHHHS